MAGWAARSPAVRARGRDESQRFSIHRLAHYCLDLAELLATERVVPMVIFLHDNPAIPHQLALASERHRYLAFDYLACELAATPAVWFVFGFPCPSALAPRPC